MYPFSQLRRRSRVTQEQEFKNLSTSPNWSAFIQFITLHFYMNIQLSQCISGHIVVLSQHVQILDNVLISSLKRPQHRHDQMYNKCCTCFGVPEQHHQQKHLKSPVRVIFWVWLCRGNGTLRSVWFYTWKFTPDHVLSFQFCSLWLQQL